MLGGGGIRFRESVKGADMWRWPPAAFQMQNSPNKGNRMQLLGPFFFLFVYWLGSIRRKYMAATLVPAARPINFGSQMPNGALKSIQWDREVCPVPFGSVKKFLVSGEELGLSALWFYASVVPLDLQQ